MKRFLMLAALFAVVAAPTNPSLSDEGTSSEGRITVMENRQGDETVISTNDDRTITKGGGVDHTYGADRHDDEIDELERSGWHVRSDQR